LFHMPVIMLNRLFLLPQTKSRVYSNRSCWTPRLHWFTAISVWLHGFWSRYFNTAKFWHVHQRFDSCKLTNQNTSPLYYCISSATPWCTVLCSRRTLADSNCTVHEAVVLDIQYYNYNIEHMCLMKHSILNMPLMKHTLLKCA
jgi:hypothetical protein